MKTILTQNKLAIVNPCHIEADYDGFIIATLPGNRKENYVILGKYETVERAKEIIYEMFKVKYYEMPLK